MGLFKILMLCALVTLGCMWCSSSYEGDTMSAAGYCRDQPFEGGKASDCMMEFKKREKIKIEREWLRTHR